MTASVVGLLGHPISVASSMVSCIVLGAGVDFAIHIGVRARAVGGDAPGQQASHQLGAVVLATGVELALAFGVLVASEMPTLRQFGMGLAIGLPMAALGAVWFAPKLYRRTR
jgi:predicted RND superfamily exporter protein